MWSDRQGQIIGLKHREREATAQAQSFASRIHELESAIAVVAQTLHAETSDDANHLRILIAWARDQLERGVDGREITRFGLPE